MAGDRIGVRGPGVPLEAGQGAGLPWTPCVICAVNQGHIPLNQRAQDPPAVTFGTLVGDTLLPEKSSYCYSGPLGVGPCPEMLWGHHTSRFNPQPRNSCPNWTKGKENSSYDLSPGHLWSPDEGPLTCPPISWG